MSLQNGYIKGTGDLKRYSVANPAAGQNFTQAVPAGKVWRLMAVRYILTTSAVVASRRQLLFIDDGATIFAAASASGDIPASSSLPINFYAGANFGGGGGQYTSPIPADVWLPSGFRVRSSIASIDPGDQISAIEFFVEEWTAQ